MKQALTIIQVLPELESGGVERVALDVGRYLISKGHRSIVISAGGAMVSRLVAEGSEHIDMDLGRKSLFTLKHVRPLRRLIEEIKPDVIDVLSRMPAWIVSHALRGMTPGTRPKWITSVHTLSSVNAYSRVMTQGDRVIVTSKTVMNYVQKSYPKLDHAKVVLVPRGIDTRYFHPGIPPSETWISAWISQFPHLEGKKLLLLPGRLARSKGHHDFITLISRLKGEGYSVHGLLMGEADSSGRKYVAELTTQIINLDLLDDISFLGQRSDVREIMNISQIIYSLPQNLRPLD
jgi:glycosyltransferase involved in cell wall biosynthesis